MKRITKSLLLALTLILLIAVPILAAYTSTITVTESSGNSYTDYPFIDSMDVDSMVSSSYITSTGLDTRILDGSTELPHMLADDKALFVGDLNANSSKQFTFTTGNSALTSCPIITGYGGYITVADNATLEPSDRYKLFISVDLEATGAYIYKEDAYLLYYDADTDTLTWQTGVDETPDQSVSATVSSGEHLIKISISYVTSPEQEVTIYPYAAGSYENIPDESPEGTAHYIIMDKGGTPSYPDNYNYVSYPDTQQSDLYIFDTPVGLASLSAITMGMWSGTNYPFSNFKFLIQMEGETLWQSNAYDPYQFGVWTTPSLREMELLTNPVTGLAWNIDDLTNIQFGFSCQRYSGTIKALGMYVTLSAGLDVPYLNLYVDDMETPEDSIEIVDAVPDNSNNIFIYPSSYINYIKLETSN